MCTKKLLYGIIYLDILKESATASLDPTLLLGEFDKIGFSIRVLEKTEKFKCLHCRFLKMNGLDMLLMAKMKKFLVGECVVAATLKPWETMTVGTQTRAQSYLQRLLHAERAILRPPSHHLQSSQPSSKSVLTIIIIGYKFKKPSVGEISGPPIMEMSRSVPVLPVDML